MKTLAIVLLVAALVGCGDRVQNSPAEGSNITIPQFEWRVRSGHGLQEIHALNGIELHAGQIAEGLQGTDPSGTVVIYTRSPVRVDDSVACTLGHEVMHIALGKYHREER
jgi:hypothetical protein